MSRSYSPGTRCNRPTCRRTYAEHIDKWCPNGEGKYCSTGPRASYRAGQSFSADEVAFLDHVVRALLSGSDLRQLARQQPRMVGVYAKKVRSMKASLAKAVERREQADLRVYRCSVCNGDDHNALTCKHKPQSNGAGVVA